MSDYCYAVVTFYGHDTENENIIPHHTLAGVYLDKKDAESAVLTSGPHCIWEWAYGVVAIEKMRLNSLGHPAVVRSLDREPISWFLWHFNEAEQTGNYVACDKPKWAHGVFGFV